MEGFFIFKTFSSQQFLFSFKVEMTTLISRRFCHQPSGIKNVAVFGGGLMGSGIAQVAAQSGFNVTLVDQQKKVLEDAQKRIRQSLEKVAKKQDKVEQSEFVDSIISRIDTEQFDANKSSTFAVRPETDLIIEAIVENMDAKHKLFSVLDASASEKTIFATNTSSLPVVEIFKHVKRQSLVGGLHYFNPVPMMKLLEVVKAESTSEETFEKLCNFGTEMNKTVVKVSSD